jgi:NADPH:quinone reductase-like Zn-dependent oxidoreductase
MKAVYVVQHGDADKAFEVRETAKPEPKTGEVLIAVEGFGLNFADIMARKGQYRDAPPLPSVIGYDVVGKVVSTGGEVSHLQAGDRVTAMTRFGGYAEFVATDARAAVKISDTADITEVASLTTQFCTAYYCAAEMVQLFAGDRVVIHSAAGGVGSALLQFALHKGCEVIATTGSSSKVEAIKKAGVHHVIDTSKHAFDKVIMDLTKGEGVDVIFDALGAEFIRKGINCLTAGGRIVCYGAASMSDSNNVFSQLGKAIQFGIYHPAIFMMSSKSLLGVNMLKLADKKPLTILRCLNEVVRLYEAGVFKPMKGKVFSVNDLTEAHRYMEGRKSQGKIVCQW